MAVTNLTTIEAVNQTDIDQLPSKLLLRSFGRDNDSIQLTIRDGGGNVILTDDYFTDYIPYINPTNNLISSIDINYEQVLNLYGYRSGQYKLTFVFQRNLLTGGENRPFSISEISPSKTEIRFQSNVISESSLIQKINDLVGIIRTSAFFKDLNLDFGRGNTVLITNAQLDKNTGLLKLYDPLPPNLGVGSSFKVYEDLINPLEVDIDLGAPVEETTGIQLQGPNFNIDFTDNYTVPSEFRTYDKILENGAVTSSFNNIQNYLSSSDIPIDLEFDNPNTSTGYHFENFIHFSSATERLKNFKYKLSLLESYSSSLATLNNITGSVTSSDPTLQNKVIFNDKTDRLIQGFDYYERYLYYESGTYAWPKTNSSKPYINAKVASSDALSWFGGSISEYDSANYGGQMLSASMFDDANPYGLANTIPPDIKDNHQNEAYVLFTEMIAQHFDGIWAYIDSLTDKYQADSGLNDGISKELVFNALTERGIRAYSQFENSSIYEYFLGDDGQGSFQYETTDGSTMVSASDAGSIPKGDISKEIWKRLYHNTPYLLKTKGTERGLKALIACYGIPESVLHVKEYGGPLQDKTGFRTFTYQKESRALEIKDPYGHNDKNNYIEASKANVLNSTKTIQFRFKPVFNSALSGSGQTVLHNIENSSQFRVVVSQSIDTSKLESGSFGRVGLVTGSNTSYSNLVPIYNGNLWNFSVTFDSGSSNTASLFCTDTTFNKNTYLATASIGAEGFFDKWASGDRGFGFGAGLTLGLTHVPNGGSTEGTYQEIRFSTEKLTEATIVTQSLSPFNYNGNTISSSYENLYLRVPLGSNNKDTNEVAFTDNKAPKATFRSLYSASIKADLSTIDFTSIEETHHLTTPDTVGSGMVSDKVRIDNGVFDDNFLDPFTSVETSPQDRQPLDYSDAGIFFSPTFEINEDIIYTLGGFRLDDYIGDPTHYTSGSYPDLKTIKDIYFQKVDQRYNFGDYIRTIQFFDHTLFKMIKDFAPAKANLKTGLVIEPHYLERTKIPGKNVDYEQLKVHEAHVQQPLINSSGSLSGTSENVHDIVINVTDYVLSGSKSTATENVAQTNLFSRKLSLS